MRRGFIWLWGLGTLLIAGLVGAAAYAAGVATHVTTATAANGAPYAYPYFYGPHLFFFPFGFIFPLFFILLILWLVFRPRRWWYGGGGGPYGSGRSHIEQRLEEWHKKAHGETPTPTDKPS